MDHSQGEHQARRNAVQGCRTGGLRGGGRSRGTIIGSNPLGMYTYSKKLASGEARLRHGSIFGDDHQLTRRSRRPQRPCTPWSTPAGSRYAPAIFSTRPLSTFRQPDGARSGLAGEGDFALAGRRDGLDALATGFHEKHRPGNHSGAGLDYRRATGLDRHHRSRRLHSASSACVPARLGGVEPMGNACSKPLALPQRQGGILFPL